MATLGRIRSFAPTAAKLADSKDEYLAAIKVRRQEEAAARKEREVRDVSGHSTYRRSGGGCYLLLHNQQVATRSWQWLAFSTTDHAWQKGADRACLLSCLPP
jgi:hypothetical protein